jgi:hypothetical protein
MSPSTCTTIGCCTMLCFQIVHGDQQGVSQPSACRIVRRISKVISREAAKIIRFLTGHAVTENRSQFLENYGVPDVLGCVDGVHIPIQVF